MKQIKEFLIDITGSNDRISENSRLSAFASFSLSAVIFKFSSEAKQTVKMD